MKKKEQMNCEMKTWANAMMYLSYKEHERKSQDQELEVEMHMKKKKDNECLQMIGEKCVKKEISEVASLKREVWFEEEAKVFVIYYCHTFTICE